MTHLPNRTITHLAAGSAALLAAVVVACGGSSPEAAAAISQPRGATPQPAPPAAVLAPEAETPARISDSAVAGSATIESAQVDGSAQLAPADGPARTPVAYVALAREFESLDPSAVVEGSLSEAAVRALFAGLFRLTGAGVEPDLAASWTASPDGLTHTFVLRDGLRWSDGTPLTARDVAFGILRSMDPAVGSHDATLLASIIRGGEAPGPAPDDGTPIGLTVVDASTLQIETSVPASFLPAILARPSTFPQPAHVAESDPAWHERPDLVSNGPFRVMSRVPGGSLVLARNDVYSGPGEPALDGIVFLAAPDEASRAMAGAGIVDAISGLTPPDSSVDGAGVPNASIKVVPGSATYSLRFDVSREPFDNALVRRAFSAALDRQALVAETAPGPARAVTTLTPSVLPGAPPPDSGIGVDYDLQRARDLLAQAGYTDFQALSGFTLVHAPGGVDDAIAGGIARAWREAFGLVVSTAEVERADGRWSPVAGPSIWLELNDSPYLDPDGWLRTLYRSGAALNAGGYSEPTYDAAVDQGGGFTDPEDRARAYRQAETILVGIDVAAFPLFVVDRYRWSQEGLIEPLAPNGLALLEAWDIPR